MRPLSGHKSVHSFSRGNLHLRPCPAGHDSNLATLLGATGQRFGRNTSGFLKPSLQFAARNRKRSANSQMPSFIEEKRLQLAQPERTREQHVIAKGGMRIERQMR